MPPPPSNPRRHSYHNPAPIPPLLLLFLLALATASMASPPPPSSSSSACPSSSSEPVKPSTPLIAFLQRVQSAALLALGPKSFDPKLYVDLPLRVGLQAAEAAFSNLHPSTGGGAITPAALHRFLEDFFGAAGSDLVYAEPPDFVPEPEGFLPRVEHPEVRAWALEVHALWRNLSRRVADDVRARPELHTLLPLPGPVVVPGSRFREVYYWDSYWIIRGLLASKMYDTAKAIVNNLISLIDSYGYVLNGARAYYSNRSQPPLLSSMVLEIYKKTGDLMFVHKSLPSLLKEYSFWDSEIHKVTIKDAHGYNHTVNRYFAMWNKPRPESATIDESSALNISSSHEKEKFYREVASTAESGWDFSSRWMRDSSDLTTLATTSIIPVDLNVFILKMELDIAFFAKLTGDNSISKRFLEASHSRREALRSIFWNDEMGQWLDYWLKDSGDCKDGHQWDASNQNRNIFASNFIPLWIGIHAADHATVKKVTESFQRSGLLRAVGIATSLSNTGQQWDFPNGWAPLQHMIAEGLAKSRLKEGRALAEDIVEKWVRTNYVAYKKSGVMHEKYDVEACGEFGGGGEYTPQTGFGWSNGVILSFLDEFGWPRHREIKCQ